MEPWDNITYSGGTRTRPYRTTLLWHKHLSMKLGWVPEHLIMKPERLLLEPGWAP